VSAETEEFRKSAAVVQSIVYGLSCLYLTQDDVSVFGFTLVFM